MIPATNYSRGTYTLAGWEDVRCGIINTRVYEGNTEMCEGSTLG